MLASCLRPAQGKPDLQSGRDGVLPVSVCREHLSLRNRSATATTVTVYDGQGGAQRVVALGRDTSTNLEYAATIIVLSSPSDSVGVTRDGQQPTWISRSPVACVRALPVVNPDSIVRDYTVASAAAHGRGGTTYAYTGGILLTFAPSASREEINALIRNYALTLIGGARGPTEASDVWAFWIEDLPSNARTERLVGELKRSPLIETAWPYLTLY